VRPPFEFLGTSIGGETGTNTARNLLVYPDSDFTTGGAPMKVNDVDIAERVTFYIKNGYH